MQDSVYAQYLRLSSKRALHQVIFYSNTSGSPLCKPIPFTDLRDIQERHEAPGARASGHTIHVGSRYQPIDPLAG